MRHVAIIPARNEERFLPVTLRSISAQTEPPDRVYIVDDGSTDATPQIAEAAAAVDPRFVLVRRPPHGERRMGGGVVDTFNAGYDLCRSERFSYVSKIDADVDLPPDYFERLLRFLDGNPRCAAASGCLYEELDGRLVPVRMPTSHVSGALKTIRKSVFDEMGGFIPTLGWDIVDLVKIRSLGHRTTHLEELRVHHLRQHGSAEGTLRGKAQWGEGAYIIGSHPLFAFLRGLYRMGEPPYVAGGLAFWWGYLRAAVARQERIADAALIAALRREQMQRLVRLNRLAQDRSAGGAVSRSSAVDV